MHTVLIVDDSDINLTLIKALVLKLGNCNPVLFDHPLKAVEWCQTHIPDLVIAFNFPTDTWVNFKLFGGMGLMLLFVLAQGMLLSKYIEEDK